jgi:hypothetical protein
MMRKFPHGKMLKSHERSKERGSEKPFLACLPLHKEERKKLDEMKI